MPRPRPRPTGPKTPAVILNALANSSTLPPPSIVVRPPLPPPTIDFIGLIISSNSPTTIPIKIPVPILPEFLDKPINRHIEATFNQYMQILLVSIHNKHIPELFERAKAGGLTECLICGYDGATLQTAAFPLIQCGRMLVRAGVICGSFQNRDGRGTGMGRDCSVDAETFLQRRLFTDIASLTEKIPLTAFVEMCNSLPGVFPKEEEGTKGNLAEVGLPVASFRGEKSVLEDQEQADALVGYLETIMKESMFCEEMAMLEEIKKISSKDIARGSVRRVILGRIIGGSARMRSLTRLTGQSNDGSIGSEDGWRLICSSVDIAKRCQRDK
ncbi:hypothetical protein BJ508DRAFT_333525 [Ascobolus immersus RN42]|uniref:Uncharacterized protein n=1 Tax=Ascobolus immersus RN42 TaxID=1160509 RepID=A0A3N4HNE2_ASCIM|nr:hypothetical protein BJ508DRAFT_333525 [Ascobolus immersus RN42]